MTVYRHPSSTEAALLKAIRAAATAGALDDMADAADHAACSLRHLSNPDHHARLHFDTALRIDIWLTQHGHPAWLVESYLHRYRAAVGFETSNEPITLRELLMTHLRAAAKAGRFSEAVMEAAADEHLSTAERRELAQIADEWADELKDIARRLAPAQQKEAAE